MDYIPPAIPYQFVHCNKEPAQPGMYLKLFHGRGDPEQIMEDWGFNGPTIGPLRWAHTTYGWHFRIQLFNDDSEDYDLDLVNDMVQFGNAYYGDWSLYIKE